MTSKSVPGQVIADIIDVRFAFSGKISRVLSRTGDSVKAGQLLASLDNRILQTELDQELADYEKTRAEFEIFVAKQGDPQNDIAKYEKTRIQSLLNSSVKAVELAKARLDQANLYSPVAGIIVDNGGNRPGLNITPASNTFRILDSASLRFRIEIKPEEVSVYPPGQLTTISINNHDYQAKSGNPVFTGKDIFIDFLFTDPSGLIIGQEGTLKQEY